MSRQERRRAEREAEKTARRLTRQARSTASSVQATTWEVGKNRSESPTFEIVEDRSMDLSPGTYYFSLIGSTGATPQDSHSFVTIEDKPFGTTLEDEDNPFTFKITLNIDPKDVPPTSQELITCSPAVQILLDLKAKNASLEQLGWRQLEELVAELLHSEGYRVELQRGTKDGGVDIIATLRAPEIGEIVSLWQVKHFRSGKVGVAAVRELADVRRERDAHKGIIVTSSYLTSGAIARIGRERHFLEKKDRDDLVSWITRYNRA